MSRGQVIPWHMILFVALVMMLVVFIFSGCLGIGERGKTFRIQVPALLDIEVDYLDGEAPPIDQAGQWRDFFVPKKDTIKSIFLKPDVNGTN